MTRDVNRNNERVFVCGAGHQGIAMAAHLALNGVAITLWNRSEKHIRKIEKTGKIYCQGVVNGCAQIERASSNIEKVFSDVIMVATPSNAHKDVAKELAPFVTDKTTIILNPGRTFGAIEFAETLKECGVKRLPAIAETQTIVYTCRKVDEDSSIIYAMKKQVDIAGLKGVDIGCVVNRLPICLRQYFRPVRSVGTTSFANVGMILHCAPVMMNIGWIESEIADFKYYYDGISRSIATFLEKMDKERIAVAKELGYNVATVAEWMKDEYEASGDSLYECIRNNASYKEIDAPISIKTRYIYEDVPNGLVPIEFIGKSIGVETRHISTVIDLACEVTGVDFRSIGRRYTIDQLKYYL